MKAEAKRSGLLLFSTIHEYHECSHPPVPEPFVLIRAIRGSTFRHHRIGPLPHHSVRKGLAFCRFCCSRNGAPLQGCGNWCAGNLGRWPRLVWGRAVGAEGRGGRKRSGLLSVEAGDRNVPAPFFPRVDAKRSGLLLGIADVGGNLSALPLQFPVVAAVAA